MPENLEDPKATKVEDEIHADEPKQKIEQIADEAAGKALKTEHRYDANHSIFTK